MNHIFLEERISTSRTIKITAVLKTSVSGRIIGDYVYSIKLFLGKSGLGGTCTYLAFADFGPCKYLAALGFAIIAYHKGDFHDLAEDFEGDVAEVGKFEKNLKNKSKDELITMILQISGWFPIL